MGTAHEKYFPLWFDKISQYYLQSHDGYGSKTTDNQLGKLNCSCLVSFGELTTRNERELINSLASQFVKWAYREKLELFSNCNDPEYELGSFLKQMDGVLYMEIRDSLEVDEPKKDIAFIAITTFCIIVFLASMF